MDSKQPQVAQSTNGIDEAAYILWCEWENRKPTRSSTARMAYLRLDRLGSSVSSPGIIRTKRTATKLSMLSGLG